MQINFIQLLQDSLNFIRNNARLFILALVLNLVLKFLTLQVSFSITDMSKLDTTNMLLPTVGIGVLDIFLKGLIILNINSVNNRNYQHFFINIPKVISYLGGLLLLSIITLIPVSVGVAIFTIYPQINIVAVPFLMLGFYFIVKLYLLPYSYLIEQPKQSIKQALIYSFNLTKGRTLSILGLILISYFVPATIISIVDSFKNDISSFGSIFLSGFFSVFSIILEFRFYQIYRQR